jgi:hypothetical protein
VDGTQITVLDQGLERRSSDAEHLGGLLWRQQQRLAGRSVRQPLWFSHVVLLARVRFRAPSFGAARLREKALFEVDW